MSIITGIEVWRANIPLRITFSHSLATRRNVETLIVAVAAADGSVGFGQALPRDYLTGETLESTLDDIKARWWPGMRLVEFDDAKTFLQALGAVFPLFEEADSLRKNASYAAVDTAVLDVFSRYRRFPAFSGDRGEMHLPLVAVVPAVSQRNAAWMARAMRWLGYRGFKVKVGPDADADALRLEAVRGVIGPNSKLIVDANQAWTPEEAEKRLPVLKRYGVTLLEEPLCREAAAATDFATMEEKFGIRIMADETICSLADARNLLMRGSPSWWNLRVGKNGGFAGVARIAAAARENGIRIYGGVLVGETSALSAAGRSALIAAGAECMEYGFPRLFLKGDPFRGGPGGLQGVMATPDAGTPGLGVRLLRNKLRRIGEIVWQAGDIISEKKGD